jgi:hypothetical protein
VRGAVTRRVALALLLAVLAFPLGLRGEGDEKEKPEAQRLPQSPWDSAQAGDWAILAGNTQERGSDKARAA